MGIPDFADMVNRSGGNISIKDAEILYNTALEIDAKHILEIGSREGGSSMALGSAAKATGGGLICIEPQRLAKWDENIEALGLRDYVTLLPWSSPWMPAGILVEASNLDYLFLDGGGSAHQPHHTRWMLVDYHYWEPSVRAGGRIAIHDWTGRGKTAYQVQRAVNIILETDNLIEVTRYESTDRGIIVFEKGDK